MRQYNFDPFSEVQLNMTRDPHKRPPNKRSTSKRPAGSFRKFTETYSFAEADDRIFDYFRNHGFGEYPHEKRHQLVNFYLLLMEEQNHQNITRLLTLREVAIKHFIDCLMVTRLTKLKFPLLDIGTGAGFPGIPLKIDCPNDPIILSEGVQKRVEFLKTLREKLELKNLDIIGRNISPTFVYPIQGAITRAVEDIGATLGSVINALQLDGEVYFMKGPNVGNEIPQALAQWGEFYALKSDITYDLPKSPHKRRLVIFKKIKHPPAISLNKIVESEE
jgi:16S rRNA (guanine527-N7)-methyltransferase